MAEMKIIFDITHTFGDNTIDVMHFVVLHSDPRGVIPVVISRAGHCSIAVHEMASGGCALFRIHWCDSGGEPRGPALRCGRTCGET